MTDTISFKFSGFSGDLIWYMSGIKKVCEDLGKKADIYLWLDRPGQSYDGAVHPYNGTMINRYAFDMLKPLIEFQSYVNKCEPWQGEKITVDMDLIRQVHVGMPQGNLAHWLGMRFTDMQPDLSKFWIEAPNQHFFSDHVLDDKILINRTSRWHGEFVSYFFLKDYKNVMFVGLKEEHEAFCKEWNLDLPYLHVNNFLQLARYIANCKFFIGNQSMCFAIAEAVKAPRILEVCRYAPNIHPVGERAHYFMAQESLVDLTAILDKELTKQTI